MSFSRPLDDHYLLYNLDESYTPYLYIQSETEYETLKQALKEWEATCGSVLYWMNGERFDDYQPVSLKPPVYFYINDPFFGNFAFSNHFTAEPDSVSPGRVDVKTYCRYINDEADYDFTELFSIL